MIRGRLCRIARGGRLCGALAVLCFAVAPGAAADAAEARVFDPALSLTGGCTEPESLDLIADPSCPEGYPVGHQSFSRPTSIITDSYGNIYVASFGGSTNGTKGRIDIFNPKGFYISTLPVPVGPKNLAVDSEGNLYVYAFGSSSESSGLRRYPPVAPYEPTIGKINYGEKEFKVLKEKDLAPFAGLEIGLEDHLLMWDGASVTEYSSAAEGNKVVNPSVCSSSLGANFAGWGLAIDLTRERIYVSDTEGGNFVIKVCGLKEPHAPLETIDGSTTPTGKFSSKFSIAVDEGTGHVFVYDAIHLGSEVVYELTETGEYITSIDHELKTHSLEGAEIAIDNGKNSPNGVLNAFGVRYLFVPAYPEGVGHLFAFGPLKQCPPEVTESSFGGVTESEGELHSKIEPCGLETSYSFEYTSEESFQEEGFAGAQVAGEGEIPAGLAPIPVSAATEGLVPGTAYRFRVFAENEEGSDEAEGEFATYPSQPLPPCLNDALRTGFSELLPDCRAYELVTPPDTNARSPMGLGAGHFGTYFASRQASPAGDKVSFLIEGGLIPGSEGTGSLGGDPYLATRGKTGWSSALAGPTGAEAGEIFSGSGSPDQGYGLWSHLFPSGQENYVHYPDGHSVFVGRGGIADDPNAEGRLISESGGHIIFATTNKLGSKAVQLEPNAPPDGTAAIYDRTADEVTHVVSLLPGNATPVAGQDAAYQGASLDGRGVAFTIGKKLYLRFDDTETYEAGENVTFAGVAEGGARIFYLEGGDLFAFDAESEKTTRFTESGDVTPVNVSADGTAAYFVSPGELTGEANPNGAIAQKGKENLYLSREGAISFVGTVTERDVEGEIIGGVEVLGGLGLWTYAVGISGSGPPGHDLSPGHLAADPSRTTPDGSALLFESRANLAGYNPEGHAEVYRYDSSGEELECISCDPTLAPATGEASLQSISRERFKPEPLNSYGVVANLRADGKRAFFQSTEPLVPGDTDKLQDVYEWEAQGVGSCTSAGGCVYLISSGHSERIDYLYAVSDNGDNAFFRSSDLLLGVDTETTPSVYDARVEGGFVEEEHPICQGEGCKPSLTPPPLLPTPESAIHEPDSPPPVKHCPKGKHKVTKNGKTSCVKNKKKHHKAGSKRKGGSK